MNLTNNCALPASIVEAVRRDPYDAGEADISCTRLIAPPLIRHLERLHGAAISEDASDRIWSLLGQAVHVILHRAVQPGELAEERLFADAGGWRISGAFDLFDGATLTDFKTTSAWSVKPPLKPEWTAQINVLAWLLRCNGWSPQRGRIVAILRDWRKNEALRYGDDYPRRQVVELPVPLWTPEDAAAYVAERVRLHRLDDPPICTPEERWDRPTVWAVQREGRRTAVRLHSEREKAEAHATALGAGHSVVERPGASVRCSQYCAVAQWCAYAQRLAEQKAGLGCPECATAETDEQRHGGR